MTLTEGFENMQLQPFLVNKDDGAISLNFDPQRGMKGYFDFMVYYFSDMYNFDKIDIFSFLYTFDFFCHNFCLILFNTKLSIACIEYCINIGTR